MRGVPLRIEIGPRDVDSNQFLMVRRDTGEKIPVPLDEAVARAQSLLEEIQRNMYEKARAFRDAHSHLHINTLEELKSHIARCEETGELPGFVLAGWCGSDECEAKVKEETKFTSRNIPFDPPARKQVCIHCGGEAKHTVWFARAY